MTALRHGRGRDPGCSSGIPDRELKDCSRPAGRIRCINTFVHEPTRTLIHALGAFQISLKYGEGLYYGLGFGLGEALTVCGLEELPEKSVVPW